MTHRIDIGGRQGRGNPEIGRRVRRNRLDDDALILDPDGGAQDSAQALYYESDAPRIPRERPPLSLVALLLAVVISCLCAAAVLVASGIDCAWRACA